MKICREFYFDAAHFLPRYRGKCERLHGHTYKLEIVVDAEKGENGMVLDFNELKSIAKESVLDRLDHQNMNEIFENPTAENIADWIFSELDKKIPVSSVKLWEGKGKWVMVER
jgi:6-pyruvoyltetrahydropterin/6-carboxytetrahydropterin synthase